MTTKIFVNLPVKNLERSKEFFTKLGYSFNPRFTDETAACMVISDDIFAMPLHSNAEGPHWRYRSPMLAIGSFDADFLSSPQCWPHRRRHFGFKAPQVGRGRSVVVDCDRLLLAICRTRYGLRGVGLFYSRSSSSSAFASFKSGVSNPSVNQP
jgi:hypothetical protein